MKLFIRFYNVSSGNFEEGDIKKVVLLVELYLDRFWCF